MSVSEVIIRLFHVVTQFSNSPITPLHPEAFFFLLGFPLVERTLCSTPPCVDMMLMPILLNYGIVKLELVTLVQKARYQSLQTLVRL